MKTFSFLPYEPSLLRCHPMAAGLIEAEKSSNIFTKCGSNKRLRWQYACCDKEFTGCPKNIRYFSFLCPDHIGSAKQERFSGSIPRHLLDVVRAGLLWGVDASVLSAIVESRMEASVGGSQKAVHYVQLLSSLSKV